MRINVVPVQTLSNVHLRAEYREILMAPHYYIRSSNTKQGIVRSMISSKYTLNKGHAMFFYNKMGYIKRRHDELESEMIRRNFKIRASYNLLIDKIDMNDMNDYQPSIEDLKINIDRIMLRISQKPKLYKERTLEEWFEFYLNLVTNFNNVSSTK